MRAALEGDAALECRRERIEIVLAVQGRLPERIDDGQQQVVGSVIRMAGGVGVGDRLAVREIVAVGRSDDGRRGHGHEVAGASAAGAASVVGVGDRAAGGVGDAGDASFRRVVDGMNAAERVGDGGEAAGAVVAQGERVAVAVLDAREFTGGGEGALRVEFPEAGVGEGEAEDAVNEDPFAEDSGTDEGAVGLTQEKVFAARAVIDPGGGLAGFHDAAHVVAVRPAIALRRRLAGARAVGAGPDEVEAAPRKIQVDGLLLKFARVKKEADHVIAVFVDALFFQNGDMAARDTITVIVHAMILEDGDMASARTLIPLHRLDLPLDLGDTALAEGRRAVTCCPFDVDGVDPLFAACAGACRRPAGRLQEHPVRVFRRIDGLQRCGQHRQNLPAAPADNLDVVASGRKSRRQGCTQEGRVDEYRVAQQNAADPYLVACVVIQAGDIDRRSLRLSQ